MIRKLTEKDRDLYIEMAKEFYSSEAVLHPVPERYFVRTVDEALQSNRYAEIFLFTWEGEAAGYALTARTFSQEAGGPVWWIEEIYIRERFRSKGLGKAFFDYIHREKGNEAARFRLEVEEDNKRAIALYERMGYNVLYYAQMVRDQKK